MAFTDVNLNNRGKSSTNDPIDATYSQRNRDEDEYKKKKSNVVSHKRNQNILIWGGFLSVSLVIYFFLSSGHISFLLTYASFMRCFGFVLMNFKIWSSHSANGLSVKAMQLYALTFIFRLFSIMSHQGYLPFDKTGDWFYHSVEIFSLCLVGLAIFGMIGPLRKTYEWKLDVFGNTKSFPHRLGAIWIVIPCVVLGALLHPALNKEFISDACWSISMYLEALAMLPQIYFFQKQAEEDEGTVDSLVGHTVFALGFSRIFELVFWLYTFQELSSKADGSATPGYIVLLSQFVHIVIMADFFYSYYKSVSRGTPMDLPTNFSMSPRGASPRRKM